MATKRFHLLLVASAAAIFALIVGIWLSASRQAASPPPVETLSLAVAENLLGLPVFIAIEKGFYAAEGLDMRYQSFPTGKGALDAMLSGDVEVAMAAETPIMRQSFQRRDFVIIASFIHAETNSQMVARRDREILSGKDLKGRRVGVLVGTTAQYFLHALLADHGLAPADITEVAIPATEMADTLSQGRVDAIAAFEPFVQQAKSALGESGHLIGAPGRVRETFNYVTGRELPQRRTEALARLLRGTERAIVWMREHREEAIAICARRMRMDPVIVAALWDNYRPILSLDQTLLISLEDQARWAMRTKLVSAAQAPNYLEFLDLSALTAVKPEAVTIIH